ncbi:CHASE3 domain-containing protein [Flavobacterium sp. NRK F10]|uniref:CHASE3 domain-containing protein n=1 Tax=Flavobacterium sp. NRK F10 TaxID=2954931 RepID=UPI002091A9B4|nr:CHASE3 domain-containing protein [Flavobacterium sp. NRK F10]MCO6173850.1 CHASE3 domain-containing protein [Flavobacterium sp. NRK F10]
MLNSKFFNSFSFIKGIFYTALFVLIFLASITYRHIKELENIRESMLKTYEVSLELEKLISYIKDAETSDRGFVLSNDSTFLEPYSNARDKVNNSFFILRKATEKDTLQQVHLNTIYNLVDRRFVYFKKEFSTRYEFQDNLRTGKQIMDSLRLEVNQMITNEKKQIHNNDRIYRISKSNTPLILFSTFLISILTIVLGYLKISKNYRRILKSNRQLKIYDELSNQSQKLGNYGTWIYHISKNEFLFSENYFNLFGLNPKTTPHKMDSFRTLIVTEDKEKYQKSFEDSLTRTDAPSITFKIKRKDTGELRYLRTKAKLITDKNGIKSLICTTRDITDDYKKALLIEERNQELEKTNMELLEFNHVASHDLQEPLRKIQTFISRIEDKETENLSENGKLYFDRIKSAASRMRILIDDLLQYSRSNRSQETFTSVDLNLMLSNSIAELSETISEQNADIRYPELPIVKGVEFQLEQLFTNLISNAIKYRKPEVDPVIKITWEEITASKETDIADNTNRKYIKIKFADNGIGFEQEFAEKIFNLFQRLHSKTDYPGTGVGLAICKKIVENHRGYILAKSIPNEGTEFIIYLPS